MAFRIVILNSISPGIIRNQDASNSSGHVHKEMKLQTTERSPMIDDSIGRPLDQPLAVEPNVIVSEMRAGSVGEKPFDDGRFQYSDT